RLVSDWSSDVCSSDLQGAGSSIRRDGACPVLLAKRTWRKTRRETRQAASLRERGQECPRHTGYGLVLAISGTAASPLRLGCCGPRWYLVSPSFRNSKLSSGESDILPASTRASKLTIFFQYALP